jgi:hypothetical protein
MEQPDQPASIFLDIGGLAKRGETFRRHHRNWKSISVNPSNVFFPETENHLLLGGKGERLPIALESVSKIELNGLLQDLPISEKTKKLMAKNALSKKGRKQCQI